MSRKHTLFAILLTAASVLVPGLEGAAQDEPSNALSSPTVPSYCNPCLEYAGDFDVNNVYANALANGCTLDYNCTSLSAANVVLIPFTVPAGQQWEVTGLFTNNSSTASVIDPAEAFWSISTGMKAGYPGKVLYEGIAPAAFTLTGMGAPLVNVYNVLVKDIHTPAGGPIILGSGRYWLTVVPQCTNPNDSSCQSAEYFAVDVEDKPAKNQYGPPEPWDDSFFYSTTYGFNYQPTWGANGACEGDGCDAFSAGVLGKSGPDNSTTRGGQLARDHAE